MENQKIAIIIGAGPAGLTAAYELLKKTNIKPIVLETSKGLGGIARTINYKGNRIDIGGHRFFSKSDRVMNWWLEILPLQAVSGQGFRKALNINYHNKNTAVKLSSSGPNPDTADNVMLVRSRLSRIFYLRKFFDYPISLNFRTFSNLGLLRILRIGLSYIKTLLFPIKDELSLEDFINNRFGKELYLTFFKDYTEKVWGVPCTEIPPEWGKQRIKGLSISKALWHLATGWIKSGGGVEQKNIETSLIQQFLYPKYGPGQMWEEVAKKVTAMGGEIHIDNRVSKILHDTKNIIAVEATNSNNQITTYNGDYFFSTMPVKDLVRALTPEAPAEIAELAKNLRYRDFITVGLLLKRLALNDKTNAGLIADNWIYIQEPDVKVGRLQIFNNWSPYMVKDPNLVWIGLEYFCNEGDSLWNMGEQTFMDFAISELAKIDIIDPKEVLDGVVIKMPKAYPAYFGSYARFSEIQNYTDKFENLFLVGRNGMHKYNNQDHSMLTAMLAVENIIRGVRSKQNLWQVNTEEEYHESK